MGNLLMAIFSGIAYALLAVVYKQVERTHCRPAGFLLAFMTTGGVIMLARAMAEHTTWGDPRFWFLGVSGGLLTYVSINLITRANAIGPASVTWTIATTSRLGGSPGLSYCVENGAPVSQHATTARSHASGRFFSTI
jgi:hypothetical protein